MSRTVTGPGIGDYRYEGFPLRQKWEWMQQGRGSAAALDAAFALGKVAELLAESDAEINRGLARLRGGWQGSASEQAAAAMGRHADRLRRAGADAGTGSSSIDHFGGSFAATKPKIVAPVHQGEQSFAGRVLDGALGITDDFDGGVFGMQSDYHARAVANRRNDIAANESLYAHQSAAQYALATFPGGGEPVVRPPARPAPVAPDGPASTGGPAGHPGSAGHPDSASTGSGDTGSGDTGSASTGSGGVGSAARPPLGDHPGPAGGAAGPPRTESAGAGPAGLPVGPASPLPVGPGSPAPVPAPPPALGPAITPYPPPGGPAFGAATRTPGPEYLPPRTAPDARPGGAPGGSPLAGGPPGAQPRAVPAVPGPAAVPIATAGPDQRERRKQVFIPTDEPFRVEFDDVSPAVLDGTPHRETPHRETPS